MKQVTAPASVFIILLAIYLWTIAPGNFWVDSAAFATCNEILGLPHSPSFPIYTIIGKAFHLISPGGPAFDSNLYSAVASSFAGVVIYFILLSFMSRIISGSINSKLVASCGAIMIGLTLPVWQSSLRAEVYALNNLLLALIMFLYLKILSEKSNRQKVKLCFLAIFIQGLAFTNHSLLALITLPLFIGMVFHLTQKFDFGFVGKIVSTGMVIFAIALSAYIYLPIRANLDPAVNSGQPKTISATFKAITRTGQDFIPASQAAVPNYAERAGALVRFIYDQTGSLILIGLIACLFRVFRNRRWDLVLMASLFPLGFLLVIWAAEFRLFNFDIVAYTGIPLAVLIIISISGLFSLAEQIKNKSNFGKFIPAVFVILAFFQLYENLYASDLSAARGSDILAESILDRAPRKSLLIVNEDNVVLPLWNHCYAQNKRSDIAVISAGALYRPDYRGQLEINYPDLLLPEVIDQNKIISLPEYISYLCDLNFPLRPIYIQYGVPGINPEHIHPDGFLFCLSEEKQEINSDKIEEQKTILENIAGNAADLLTREFVARNAFNLGTFYDRRRLPNYALEYFEYAIRTDDENPEYFLRLGIAMLNSGRTADAVLLLEQATKIGEGCPEAEQLLNKLSGRKLSLK
ncbi:MAG: DUF2723 domain-containing protein [candidate division Zixibacteria bacterium]